jgi:hypothetical protein
LREGANQLEGQVGVLRRIWEPHPNDFPDPCASWPLRPARLALWRKAVECPLNVNTIFVEHLSHWYSQCFEMLENNFTLKDRVRAFWQENPCGTKFADAPPGSRRFYELVEEHRYTKEWHIPTAAGLFTIEKLKRA